MVFSMFLTLHIITGAIGLLTGILNILRKKGDHTHKLIGRVFYVSMLTASISALVLASLHSNYFLFMVGIFTLYMVSSGQYYLRRKQKDKLGSKTIEWGITILMLISGLVFIGFGILTLVKSNLFGLVFLTFGGLGLLFVQQDFKNYTGKATTDNYWLLGHIQRMTGSFIAALTAFLVVNAKYFPEQIPGFVYWLLPTVILTPLINKWCREYKVKKVSS
ncbi:MAG: DUF2306 domain-containing protein [Saprospiraceae bacterium]|nr:DUF2306 domain-containing protein [Saprospiraceae bacterium]